MTTPHSYTAALPVASITMFGGKPPCERDKQELERQILNTVLFPGTSFTSPITMRNLVYTAGSYILQYDLVENTSVPDVWVMTPKMLPRVGAMCGLYKEVSKTNRGGTPSCFRVYYEWKDKKPQLRFSAVHPADFDAMRVLNALLAGICWLIESNNTKEDKQTEPYWLDAAQTVVNPKYYDSVGATISQLENGLFEGLKLENEMEYFIAVSKKWAFNDQANESPVIGFQYAFFDLHEYLTKIACRNGYLGVTLTELLCFFFGELEFDSYALLYKWVSEKLDIPYTEFLAFVYCGVTE